MLFSLFYLKICSKIASLGPCSCFCSPLPIILLKSPLLRWPVTLTLPNPMISFSSRLFGLSKMFTWTILLEKYSLLGLQILCSHDAVWLLLFVGLAWIFLSPSSSVWGAPASDLTAPTRLHFCRNLTQHQDFKFHHWRFQIFQCLSLSAPDLDTQLPTQSCQSDVWLAFLIYHELSGLLQQPLTWSPCFPACQVQSNLNITAGEVF